MDGRETINLNGTFHMYKNKAQNNKVIKFSFIRCFYIALDEWVSRIKIYFLFLNKKRMLWELSQNPSTCIQFPLCFGGDIPLI